MVKSLRKGYFFTSYWQIFMKISARALPLRKSWVRPGRMGCRFLSCILSAESNKISFPMPGPPYF